MTRLKRIKYVSEFSEMMTSHDIDRLAKESAQNNAELEITGILVASGQLFFQVIEGPEENVDRLIEVIKNDSRHHNVFLLNAESGVADRMFPDWSMKAVDLDSESSAKMEPLKAILTTIVENCRQVDLLAGVLERGIWQKITQSM